MGRIVAIGRRKGLDLENDNLRAAFLIVLGAVCYVINDAFVKSLTGVLEWHQAITLRGLVASVFLLVLAVPMDGAQSPRQILRYLRQPTVSLRVMFEILGASIWVVTLLHMPLSGAVAINQLAPVFMMLAGAVIFRETLGVHRLGAAAISFLGVLLVVKPGGDSFTTVAFLALLATALMASRDMVTRRMPRELPVVYIASFSATALTLFGFCFSVFSAWPPLDTIIIFGVVGAAVAQALAFLFVISGYRMGEVSFLAPFRYSALVAGLLIALLAFGEIPDLWSIIGALLIIAGGLYILARERRLRRRVTETLH